MPILNFGYALSCFNHLNGNPERTLEEKLDLIVESGATGYQVDLPLDWDLEYLKKEAQRRNLTCIGVNDWGQKLEHFDDFLKIASFLEAEYYNHHFPKSFTHDLAGAIQSMKELKKKCSNQQVRYLVELHRGTLTHSLERTYEITLRYPEVEYLSDASHYIIQGYHYEQIRPLFPNIKALHLRVANGECSQPEIHEDKTLGLDTFEVYFKELIQKGFEGPVVSEIIPYYNQYPFYDIHRSNCEILRLSKKWANEVSSQ